MNKRSTHAKYSTRDRPHARSNPSDEEASATDAEPKSELQPKPGKSRSDSRTDPKRADTSDTYRDRNVKTQMDPILRFFIKLAIVAGAAAVVLTFVLGVHIQHGNRMYPFIMDGDLLITYRLGSYRTGDAVAYKNPVTGETAISRIAVMGTHEVEITEAGELLVDGYPPSENVFYRTEQLDGSEVDFPYLTSADGYFLLDDFRTQGVDSRAFGEIKEDDILGKVSFVLRRRGI